MPEENDLQAFDIVWKLYEEMNFPTLPLEESLKHSEGKRILHDVARYLVVEKRVICESQSELSSRGQHTTEIVDTIITEL